MGNQDQVFGQTILISGSESLLAERAVSNIRARALAQIPDALLNIVDAGKVEAGELAEITGGSLFSSASIAVISDLGSLSTDLHATLISLAENTPEDVCLVLVHPGGVKGKGLVDKIKKTRCQVITVPTLKSGELVDFVTREARSLGSRIDVSAAQALIMGVGQDLRSLAAAISQLHADTAEGEPLTQEFIKRYFGGRAEVTSFSVADDVLNGRPEGALEKLRWALETGVAPVLMTSALANTLRTLGKYLGAQRQQLRDNEIAAIVGCPPWKVKDLARQSRVWNEDRIARGISLVAQADADIKGAAGSPDFTLEKLVLQLSRR
ncbi:MAG: DNA polymerase III subunit delta [Propionibacteriaceae bacterium]